MLLLSAKRSRSLVCWGRHLVKGGSECHLTAQLSRLEQWWNITLFLLKTYRECINWVLKSCQGIFLGYALHAGRIWKGDMVVAGHWRIGGDGTHPNSVVKGSMQRKCSRPREVKNFIFPIADGTVKLSGGDQALRTATLIRDR